jgi:GNAT superfamily N-acetyltransferase
MGPSLITPHLNRYFTFAPALDAPPRRAYGILAEPMKRSKSTSPGAPVRVRTARESDLEQVAALYRELHLESYGKLAVPRTRMRRAYRRLARDRRHRILVAERGGKVIGTLHLIVVPHLGHGLRPFGVIENVVVAESARSGGVGQAMLAAAGEIARRAGCYKLTLTSNIRRRRAHRFYARLGWRRTHYGYSLGSD